MTRDYLNRLRLIKEEISLNEHSLKELHKNHVFNIPFENVDIHSNEAIVLDIQSILHKVVRNNRGGFCYELNYLFYTLLTEIGFETSMISARIYNEDGVLGPEFDHMSLIVNLKEKWLLDVGFGDLFIYPIKIEHEHITKDWHKFYKVDKLKEGEFMLFESKDGKSFTKKYQFTSAERKIEDFKQQCQFKQNSPDSYFVRNFICTMPNPEGRNTIFNNKLIERTVHERKETEISGKIELTVILREKFNILIEKNNLLFDTATLSRQI